MIITTTPNIDGYKVDHYHGIVTGEAIMGANIVRDLMASITDIVGGRSKAYESKLEDGRNEAFREMTAKAERLNANAILGVDIDYEVIGQSMLMVAVSGTAVTVSLKES
ncbi:MAG: YbjQ family protein [Candidatus Cloacimonetes bacterium]|nr:YbjQ family protein [Candidatus Cloacimonadota bacterium]HNZ07882.1 YbjQ family protein [Candidatus Cloacimonadota bacterium]HOH79675.1 YbjQ family protein [Candidatus Cloacimonadota bacterium]HPN41045.1 YbjQ family protein [Candidatus Cloacimonadota bacterium]